MVVGIGTDLIDIDRIEKTLGRHSGFKKKLFSPREQEMLEEKHWRSETVAGNFAGKEAVLKVFGTGLRGCKWTEIEILRDSLGKPYVVLSGGALEISEALKINEVLISLAHSKNQAIAYAIGIRRT